MSDSGHTLDINATFRGGGRSIEWLDEINKASIVMLAETGIVPKDVAKRIARGIAQVIENEKTGEKRTSADYLGYEPRLIAVAGQEASRLHTGRSRQDLASTIARMNLRDGLLHTGALIADREKLLRRAEEHIETIIPAYTHGVQAQQTTFAHYLLAFESALARATERDAQRDDWGSPQALDPPGSTALWRLTLDAAADASASTRSGLERLDHASNGQSEL